MSTVTQDAPPAEPKQPLLARRRMPRWAPAGIAVAAIALGAGIGAGAALASHIQWGLLALALFVILTYGLTAAVEGRRQAKDRLATSAGLGVLRARHHPAVSLIQTTVSKGVKVLDGNFLTHSMARRDHHRSRRRRLPRASSAPSSRSRWPR